MNKIYEKAFAKINYNLRVLSKRNDGFHNLESVVLPLDFYDEIILEFSDKNQVVSNVEIENNVVLQTLKLFQETYNLNRQVKITLNKQIPIGSGLGGGSANISATIRGLNKLYELNLPLKELELIANKLGSDTLFCLYNKPAIISGRGDEIRFINFDEFNEIFVITLPFKTLTKDVFFSHIIKENNKSDILNYKNNDLLETLLNISPEFKDYYDQIKQLIPDVKMTGSGPTLFSSNVDTDMLEKLNYIKGINVYKIKIKK